jgi:hypothetical protein
MNEIAIVSEGVTDYAVLKNILLGWFKGQDQEPVLNAAQPDPNANGESSWQQYGNWENVLRLLNEKKHRDALEYAEYLIIQIDTDASERPGFDVPQREDNEQLGPLPMIERVAAKLREIIGDDDLEFYQDRIIFAICVREIECWLLPLWDSKKAHKCEGCLKAVDRALAQAGRHILGTEPKDARRYEEASKDYKKHKVLLAEGPKSPSLGVFLQELERRKIVLTAE